MDRLKNLSVEELEHLKARIELILMYKKKGSSFNPDLCLFYTILARELNRVLKSAYPEDLILAVSKDKKLLPLLRSNFLSLREWSISAFKMRFTKIDKVKLFHLYYKVIESEIYGMSIPLSLRTVLNVGQDFPCHFNNQFPLYLQTPKAVEFLFAAYESLKEV